MKRFFRLALSLSAVLALQSGGIAGIERRGASKKRESAAVFHARRIPHRQDLSIQQTKSSSIKPMLDGVQEINEAALAKLLQRAPTVSGTSATSEANGVGITTGASSDQSSAPLLVNFWATWCDPCREEFPDLVIIDKEYRARGLEFFTISLDDVSDIKTIVPEFLQAMKANHIRSFLLNATNPEAAISSIDKTWRGELPATFLFDQQGRLVFRHTGRIKPNELREALNKVIKS